MYMAKPVKHNFLLQKARQAWFIVLQNNEAKSDICFHNQ